MRNRVKNRIKKSVDLVSRTHNPENLPKIVLAASVAAIGDNSIFPTSAIDRDSYPRAKGNILAKCPVTSSSLSKLAANLKGNHLFKGTSAITSEGVPFVLAAAIDVASFKSFHRQHVVVLAWNWATVYGNVVSFSFYAGPGIPIARTFIPADDPVYRAALATGKIAFGACHGSKVSPFFLADFREDPLHYKGLVDIGQTPIKSNFLFHDFDLAYWTLMGVSHADWTAQISRRPQDSLQTGWAIGATHRVIVFQEMLSRPHADDLAQELPAYSESEGFREMHPHFCRLCQAIATAEPLETILALAGEALMSDEAAHDIICGIPKAIPMLQTSHCGNDLVRLAQEAVRLSCHVHPSVHAGLQRPWFDSRGEMLALKFIELDPVKLGIRAKNYWIDVELSAPYDHGLFMTNDDIPANRHDIRQSLDGLALGDSTMDGARSLIRSLLAEAKEHRQWSVPWGARVKIPMGNFQYIDIYQMDSVFHCLLRDSGNRYALALFDINMYAAAMADGYFDKEGNEASKIESAMVLGVILAGIIRDFIVVENRESIFGQLPRKGSSPERSNPNPGLSIIYLPLVHYTNVVHTKKAERVFSDFKPRAAHDVRAHLRKASKASARQQIQAHKLGVIIPAGATYVCSHRRGQQAGQETRREYRSRSVTHMLFPGLKDVGRNKIMVRFDFDRNVAQLMKYLGLTVENIDASSSGDDGVNVLAFNSETDEIWGIRCICFSPKHKVGVDTIRDLAASLHCYPQGTKGMVVTTSSFTQDAVDEAQVHGLILMDGAQFATSVQTQSHGPVSR